MVRRTRRIPKASYAPDESYYYHMLKWRRTNNDPEKEINSEEGEPDRLSDLLDGLLSNILSRLSTKEAVQTSAVSKKWKYKWACIYNLDFSDITSSFRRRFRKERFISFVDRVLMHGGNSAIQNFNLKCSSNYKSNLLHDWISTALRRNVENLGIHILNAHLDLPGSIYESKFLKELKILSKVTFSIPSETLFSKLREINFKHVSLMNQDLNNGDLLLKFPFLESFSMYCCEWGNVTSVKLEAPMLSTFSASYGKYEFRNWIDGFDFGICGFNLVDFTLSGELIENIVLPSPSPVQSATIKLIFSDERIPGGNRAARILRQMTALTYLELSGEVLIALQQAAEMGNLPLFGKLIHLKIYTTHNSFTDGATIVGLLQKTPVLEILTVDMSATMGNDQLKYDGSENEAVPACFTYHLKQVKFLYPYKDCLKEEEELGLMKFILKNAKELQLMEHVAPENRPTPIPSPQMQERLMSFATLSELVEFSFS